MDQRDRLAAQFEEHRPRLRRVAYRMLGSAREAEDAVQETWLRLARTDASAVDNLGGWLTTVVGRVCLNILRARGRRPESPFGDEEPAAGAAPRGDGDPEEEMVLADEVGLAMLVVLDRLTPAERLAFVLHDMFAVSFEEIATLLDRSPAAARQLASRARRRVAGVPAPEADVARQRHLAEAYLAAARGRDFDALLNVLDPDVVLTADRHVGPTPEPVTLRGSRTVAGQAILAADRGRFARAALVDGNVALILVRGGRLALVLAFTYEGDRITAVDIIGDPERLERLYVAVLDPPGP